MLGATAEPRTLAHQKTNASHRSLFIKLTSQTILTTNINIIEDLQKQLSKNDMVTTKIRLKMKIVKTLWNCRNMFGH